MRRTTVFLTKAQQVGLAEAAKPDGLTPSALIRIAVNEYLARRRRKLK